MPTVKKTPAAAVHQDLPKVISVFCSGQSTLQRVTYIVRMKETKTLKQVIADVKKLLKINPNQADVDWILTDLNGKKVKSLKELYFQSPSTFVLSSDAINDDKTESSATADLVALPKLTQVRGASAAKTRTVDVSQDPNTWVYGNSKLRYTNKPVFKPQEKLPQKSTTSSNPVKKKPTVPKAPRMLTEEKAKQKQVQKENQSKKVAGPKSKPGVKTIKKKGKTAKEEKSEQPEAKNSDSDSAAKKSETKAKDESNAAAKSKEEKPKDENSKPPEEIAKPKTFFEINESQIVAQERKIRSLQDKMQEGSSFLDKIGQPELVPRANHCVLFGMDLRMDTKSQPKTSPREPTRNSSKYDERQIVSVRNESPFAVESPPDTPKSQPPQVPDDRSELPTDSVIKDEIPLIRPQTVTLRRHTIEPLPEPEADTKLDDQLSTIDE